MDSHASLFLFLRSNQRDRNTLPKKGLRYQLQSQEETKERRHSHTIGGLPESDDQSELPSPPALSMSLSAKGQLTNIVHGSVLSLASSASSTYSSAEERMQSEVGCEAFVSAC